MDLYVCGVKLAGAGFGHPCARAGKALEKAGYDFNVKAVGGFKNIPFSSTKGKRDRVVELSGQEGVPILVLDDGSVITDSSEIIKWAEANPAS